MLAQDHAPLRLRAWLFLELAVTNDVGGRASLEVGQDRRLELQGLARGEAALEFEGSIHPGSGTFDTVKPSEEPLKMCQHTLSALALLAASASAFPHPHHPIQLLGRKRRGFHKVPTNMTIPHVQHSPIGTSRRERVLAPLTPRIRHAFLGERWRNDATSPSPPLSNFLVVSRSRRFAH